MAKNSDKGYSQSRRLPWILLTVVVLLLGIGIGIMIGYFLIRQEDAAFGNDHCSLPSWDDVISKVDRDRLRENLRQVASHPHTAGQERDEELVSLIKSRWENDGLDEVKLYSYEVLLSHPDPKKYNKVRVMDVFNNTIYTTLSYEEELRPGELKNLVPAFNAYSASGTVQGQLVFVNYAQKTDFETLKKIGINVTGLICLARYGKIFRGNQVLNAYEEGAKGIIFYSDPQEVAPLGTEADKVYPNNIFLPPTGMQRGTVYLGSGDPLTPSWPSIKGAYRIQPNKADLPKIPSQPIGYKCAQYLLKLLKGKLVPEEWGGGEGSMTNISIGPGFHSSRVKEVVLEVHNTLKLHTIRNVVGKIRGQEEPDRYVILGNHRDAWGFGAADPSSGTAQLLETVRVLGNLKQQGWRPKRSILFASWGAEEYGIIGSQEWVEEMGTAIAAQGVALVNTDTCVSGSELEISASPLLYSMATRALTKVISPNDPGTTLYKEWRRFKAAHDNIEDWTLISSPGAGTDEAPFSFYVGIPSVDIWFRSRARKEYNISIYPTYHTGYDNLYLMEKFVDPSFNIHKACSQLAITMLLELAESHILPFNFHHLADSINRAYATIKENEMLLSNYVELDDLSAAIDNFTDVAHHWQETMEAETKERCLLPLKARILNDQMMQVERSFILPEGLPGAPANRHVVFSPSSFDAYEGGGFPGILDLLYKLSNKELATEIQQELSNLLKKHVSDILVHIVQATHMLRSI